MTGTPSRCSSSLIEADLHGAAKDQRFGEILLDCLAPGLDQPPLRLGVVLLEIVHAEFDMVEAGQAMLVAVLAHRRHASGAPICGGRR